MTLPKQNRLQGKREFSRVFSEAHPTTTESFSLRFTQNNTGNKRQFAVVVSAKIAPLASVRNLLRRRTSEALRRIIREYPTVPGIHAVISVRTTHLPEMVTLKRELLSLMKKSGILHT